jgi:hypothetical protein
MMTTSAAAHKNVASPATGQVVALQHASGLVTASGTSGDGSELLAGAVPEAFRGLRRA